MTSFGVALAVSKAISIAVPLHAYRNNRLVTRALRRQVLRDFHRPALHVRPVITAIGNMNDLLAQVCVQSCHRGSS